MKNYATRYLALYIRDHNLSPEVISKKLNIPLNKILPDTLESLAAEEFLALCRYLQVRPEKIALEKRVIFDEVVDSGNKMGKDSFEEKSDF